MTVRIEDLRKEGKKMEVGAFSAGQTVRVFRKIKEGDKERVQIFDGLVIQVRNQKSTSASITVRKIVGGIGVEQVFPVHSPLIEKIELVKEAKVRRGRLYFMRNLRGKAARLKERFFTEEELKSMQPVMIEEVLETEPVIEEEKPRDDTETANDTAEAAENSDSEQDQDVESPTESAESTEETQEKDSEKS